MNDKFFNQFENSAFFGFSRGEVHFEGQMHLYIRQSSYIFLHFFVFVYGGKGQQATTHGPN